MGYSSSAIFGNDLPLYAAFDADDSHHAACRELLDTHRVLCYFRYSS